MGHRVGHQLEVHQVGNQLEVHQAEHQLELEGRQQEAAQAQAEVLQGRPAASRSVVSLLVARQAQRRQVGRLVPHLELQGPPLARGLGPWERQPQSLRLCCSSRPQASMGSWFAEWP